MSTSKTTTKLGLPLPQPGDMPDWYDLGAASQLLENLFGVVNGFATLDKDGNAAQMPTLAKLIAAGLAAGTNGDANNALKLGGVDAAKFPQASGNKFDPTLYGQTTAGTPTYTSKDGSYFKIGPFVIVTLTIKLTSKGGMAGQLIIGGLPFAPATYGAGIFNFSSLSGVSVPSGSIPSGGTFNPNGLALTIATTSGTDWLTADMISDGFTMWGPATGFYLTNQ